MELLGTVVRLQVQRSPLKPGPQPRRYRTDPLQEVPALRVGPRGVHGLLPDGPVLDVHHADHPDTRNRGPGNGLSVMSLGGYRHLRQRYGDHLADGTAGESLLLDLPGRLDEAALGGRLELETVDGPALRLTAATAAAPCVEFTCFVLRREPGEVDEPLRSGMRDLGGGARGLYLQVAGEGRVQAGARLWRHEGAGARW